MKMKKILSLLLAIAMMASLITVSVSAEGEAVIISAENVEGAKVAGDTFTVDVKMALGTATSVTGFKVGVTYDTDVMELTDITDKGIFVSSPTTKNVGTGLVAWAGAVALIPDGNSILELTFKVKDVAGDVTKTITIADPGNGISDNTMAPCTSTTGEATVSLKESFTATGFADDETKEAVYASELGKSAADVIAELEKETFVVKNVDGEITGEVKATDWTSEDYNSEVATGDAEFYTFTGTVAATDTIKLAESFTEKTVTAKVTVGKIALPTEDVVLDDVAVKQDKNGSSTAAWSDLVESGDLKLPTEVTIGEGAYEKIFDLSEAVWTGEGTLDLVNPTDDSTYAGNVVNLTTRVEVADDAWYADGTFDVAVQVYVKKKSSNSLPAPGYGVPVGGNKVDSSNSDETTTPDDTTTPDHTTTPDDTTTPDVVETVPGVPDVPVTHWAAAPIQKLKEAGIVSGDANGNFNPDSDITRAEVTKMVVGLMGIEAAGEAAFADCTADDWFTPYVAAAAEAGLVNGVSETEFAPNRTITRQEAFTIIGRAIAAVTGEADAIDFTDAHAIEEYAAPYIALLVEMGIVNGYEDGSIRPVNNITRAEVAKVIAALMDIVNAEVEEEVTEEVTEETTEEATEEATEEVTEETTEEATEEATEEVTEETTEEVVEEETTEAAAE